MFCSTRSTVTPPSLRVTTRSNMVRTRMGLKPREGSSSMRISGRFIMARPIASICCSPPLKEPALWPCRDLRTGKSPKAFSRDSSTCVLALGRYAPSLRFSRTVRLEKSRLPSGTWEIPASTTSCGFRNVTGLSERSISPLATRLMPEMVLSSVDLPAPFAPTRDTMLPFSTLRDTPHRACTSP